jgi:hypothetical protein
LRPRDPVPDVPTHPGDGIYRIFVQLRDARVVSVAIAFGSPS